MHLKSNLFFFWWWNRKMYFQRKCIFKEIDHPHRRRQNEPFDVWLSDFTRKFLKLYLWWTAVLEQALLCWRPRTKSANMVRKQKNRRNERNKRREQTTTHSWHASDWQAYCIHASSGDSTNHVRSKHYAEWTTYPRGKNWFGSVFWSMPACARAMLL